MKLSTKILAVAFVAAIALTVTTVASAESFGRNLTIGSTGADVMELQQFLNSNPATVVAVTGVGSAGMESSYFGGLTKAAVAKYQVANGITPAVGYFGPTTRASVNAGGAVSGNFPAGCSNASGFSSVTGLACVALPSNGPCSGGAAFNSVTGASCSNPLPAGCTTTAGFSPSTGIACSSTTGTVSANGTDGTLTSALSSYVGSGIQVKKGETKNVLATTLKASIGPVTVTRAGVLFNTRPWLLFSQVVLKDSTGRVIATKALNSAADVTEITVGSEYLVTFDGVNYTVTPGINQDLTVAVSVLPATDKITNGMSVQVAFDTLRTINGIGWTDTVDKGTLGATAGTSNSVFTLTSTGSVADIYTRISPSSLAARQVAVSLTQTTYDVVLGTFSLKSANNSSQLNTLTVTIASTTLAAGAAGTSGASSAYSNVRLFNGSTSYGGTLTNAGVVTFSNLSIPLSQDVWNDLTVKTDVNASTTGAGITVAVNGANGVVVTDANYGTATYEAGTATSNAVTLTVNSVTVANASLTAGAYFGGATPTGREVNGTVTLTNNSNNDLYVSATTTTFITQTVKVNGVASTTVDNNLGTLVSTASPATYSGDVANVGYVIPAGLSRTFTFVGAIRGTAGQSIALKATAILYGTAAVDGSNHGSSITAGIDNMSATGQF